jgi:hypothetical protein
MDKENLNQLAWEVLRSCGAEPEHPHLIDRAEDVLAEALREAEERGAMWMQEAAAGAVNGRGPLVARGWKWADDLADTISALSPAEVCAARRGR